MSEDTQFYLIAIRKDGKLQGPVKVGISRALGGRLSSLQSGSPYPLEVFFSFTVPTREVAFALERCFQEVQEEKRLSGEWFDFNPFYALGLMCICIKTHLIFALDEPVSPEQWKIYDAACEYSGVSRASKILDKMQPQEAVH